jgi:hypothetical protein
MYDIEEPRAQFISSISIFHLPSSIFHLHFMHQGCWFSKCRTCILLPSLPPGGHRCFCPLVAASTLLTHSSLAQSGGCGRNFVPFWSSRIHPPTSTPTSPGRIKNNSQQWPNNTPNPSYCEFPFLYRPNAFTTTCQHPLPTLMQDHHQC